MPSMADGLIVEVVFPENTFQGVEYEAPSLASVTVLPVRGEPGPAGPDGSAALAAHVDSARPHINAESGRDFAAWYNAGII